MPKRPHLAALLFLHLPASALAASAALPSFPPDPNPDRPADASHRPKSLVLSLSPTDAGTASVVVVRGGASADAAPDWSAPSDPTGVELVRMLGLACQANRDHDVFADPLPPPVAY
jgi:hypothetical protein